MMVLGLGADRWRGDYFLSTLSYQPGQGLLNINFEQVSKDPYRLKLLLRSQQMTEPGSI